MYQELNRITSYNVCYTKLLRPRQGLPGDLTVLVQELDSQARGDQRRQDLTHDFNREALAIEIDLNLPAQRVIRVLDRIALERGYPQMLRMDNGPEFISLALAEWAENKEIKLEFIKPGTPVITSYSIHYTKLYDCQRRNNFFCIKMFIVH